MPTKAKIKFIKSLHQKKYRQEYKQFIAETPKHVYELMMYQSYRIDTLFASEAWIKDNKDLLKTLFCRVEESKQKELDSMTALKKSNEVIALVNIDYPMKEADTSSWAVYLDDIRDPGNMGTIIRTADWFGIEHIFASHESVEFYNPKVVQASMGSFFHLDLLNVDFQELTQLYEHSYALTLGGEPMQGEIYAPGLIVIGNEAHGISDQVLQNSTRQLTIGGSGKAESLNAAVAFAIACSKMTEG